MVVLDGAKGLAAVLVARVLGASDIALLLAGPASIMGHAFPVFLRFRGGKGLATTVGILLAWAPWPTLTSLALLGLAQLWLHNFDRSIYVGSGAAILLPVVFGYPWTMSAYALGHFCMLWARKLQDRRHQQRVWSTSGWTDMEHSDWYGDSPVADKDCQDISEP